MDDASADTAIAENKLGMVIPNHKSVVIIHE